MKDMHAYITVHDQEIIIEYEKTGKLSKVFGKDYTYVFVGFLPVDKLSSFTNIIICRELPYHIENHKKLVTFTAWYALVQNDLLQHEYNIMLEYDVVLSPKFAQVSTQTVKKSKSKQLFSFIANPKEYFFYEYLPKSFLSRQVIIDKREEFIIGGGSDRWMGSSNSVWEINTLKTFVNWFSCWLNNDEFMQRNDIGHIVERAITVFAIFNNIHFKFISGVLEHYFLDSHETQAGHNGGVQKKYQDHIKELARK